MFLIDDLLVGVPLQISKKVLKEIKNKVDKEMGVYEDPEEVLQDLKKLQVSLETGEITREEYDKREEELLDILESLESLNEQNQKG